MRGSVPSNRKPSLALLLTSVVSRDSLCASARYLQAAKVVRTKCELLERGRATAAAATVGERLILSHALGQQRGRHHRPVSRLCCNFYNNIVKFASFSHVPTLGCAAAPPGPGPGRPGHRATAEDAPERFRAVLSLLLSLQVA